MGKSSSERLHLVMMRRNLEEEKAEEEGKVTSTACRGIIANRRWVGGRGGERGGLLGGGGRGRGRGMKSRM